MSTRLSRYSSFERSFSHGNKRNPISAISALIYSHLPSLCLPPSNIARFQLHLSLQLKSQLVKQSYPRDLMPKKKRPASLKTQSEDASKSYIPQKRPAWSTRRFEDLSRSYAPRRVPLTRCFGELSRAYAPWWSQQLPLPDLLLVAWALFVFVSGVYFNFHRILRAPWSIGHLLRFSLDLIAYPGRLTGRLLCITLLLGTSYLEQVFVCP